MIQFVEHNNTSKDNFINQASYILNLNIPKNCFSFSEKYGLKESGVDLVNVFIDYDERLFNITEYLGNISVILEEHPIIKIAGTLFYDSSITPYYLYEELGGGCGTEMNIFATVNYPKKHYEIYLKSDKWRLFKNNIIKERGFNCELCSSKKNIQMHHLTYERLGNEDGNDVMILCQQCHEKAHFGVQKK